MITGFISWKNNFMTLVNKLKTYKKYYPYILIGTFLILRIFLINFNETEWGDSFDFLRISRALNKGAYPLDTKRLPLYPLLLSIVSETLIDRVLWGRVLSFFLHAFNTLLLYKLCKFLFSNRGRLVYFPPALFLLSPITLHWSLRIMSESLYLTFVLISLIIIYRKNNGYFTKGLNFFRSLSVGISTLVRYEGILLFISHITVLLREKKLKQIIQSSFIYAITVSPIIFLNLRKFNNPFHSEYFSDPSGFNLNASHFARFFSHTIWMYSSPLVFVLILFGIYKIYKEKRIQRYFPILLYILLNLITLLFWSSDSRMFYTIAALLSLFAIEGIEDLLKKNKIYILGFTISILLFTIMIFLFRPVFITGNIISFLFNIFLSSTVVLILILKREKFKIGYVLIAILATTSLTSSIALIRHRDLNGAIQKSIIYLKSTEGNIAYWESIGITKWYFPQRSLEMPNVMNEEEQLIWLKENNIKFVIWTNESQNEGVPITVIFNKNYKENFEEVLDNKTSWPNINSKVFKTNFSNRIYKL